VLILGKVKSMKPILTAALCLLVSSNALADVLRKFDEYATLSFSEEKVRLDNLAIQMQREPELVAWYIIFAGKQSCAGEVHQRAVRAKNYLVKKYGIRADRIKWADEGYRDNLLVEIWLMPRHLGKPTSSYASIYSRDAVVLRNCKSKYHKQRRIKL
jgi:hypothetical protein